MDHSFSSRFFAGFPVQPLVHLPYGREEFNRLIQVQQLEFAPENPAQLKFFTAEDVQEVLLPLAKLIVRDFSARRKQHEQAAAPYCIGICGSVASGKSSFATVLAQILQQFSPIDRTDVISTDSFLFPNSVLKERGILERKGFPESYDTDSFRELLHNIRSSHQNIPIRIPVYSHERYDIVPTQMQEISNPQILIFEGIRTFEGAKSEGVRHFDCSFFLDAATDHLKSWFFARFYTILEEASKDARSTFYQMSQLPSTEQHELACYYWNDINEVNLLEHILPTRKYADIVLTKNREHSFESITFQR